MKMVHLEFDKCEKESKGFCLLRFFVYRNIHDISAIYAAQTQLIATECTKQVQEEDGQQFSSFG